MIIRSIPFRRHDGTGYRYVMFPSGKRITRNYFLTRRRWIAYTPYH